MSPKQIHDVIPPGRRTIRHIPLPERGEERRSKKTERKIESPKNEAAPAWRSHGRRHSAASLWVIAAAAALTLIFSVSAFFTSASVVIEPKTAEVRINVETIAQRGAAPAELHFETISVKKETSVIVTADGEQFVERKASGRIVIYNNYSSSPQRLVKNTRFETPSGLIYRLPQSISVPGRRSEEGRLVPGSIETIVYADAGGSEYNIGLSDFTVPGFKNNPGRYKGFYARSKTPMTGGFVGMEKTLSAEKLRSARDGLRSELKIKVVEGVKANLPQGFTLFKDAVFTSFESQPTTAAPGGNIVVQELASSTAVIFNTSEFNVFVAKQSLPQYDGAPVRIDNPEGLKIIVDNTSGAEPLLIGDSIRLSLNGTARLVWEVNADKVQSAVAGKRRTESQVVFLADPGIERARFVIRPFWRSKFPDDPRKIKVKIEQREPPD